MSSTTAHSRHHGPHTTSRDLPATRASTWASTLMQCAVDRSGSSSSSSSSLSSSQCNRRNLLTADRQRAEAADTCAGAAGRQRAQAADACAGQRPDGPTGRAGAGRAGGLARDGETEGHVRAGVRPADTGRSRPRRCDGGRCDRIRKTAATSTTAAKTESREECGGAHARLV